MADLIAGSYISQKNGWVWSSAIGVKVSTSDKMPQGCPKNNRKISNDFKIISTDIIHMRSE